MIFHFYHNHHLWCIVTASDIYIYNYIYIYPIHSYVYSVYRFPKMGDNSQLLMTTTPFGGGTFTGGHVPEPSDQRTRDFDIFF